MFKLLNKLSNTLHHVTYMTFVNFYSKISVSVYMAQ